MATEETLARLEALCAAALADTERAPGMGRYSRAWDVYTTAARDACPALLRIARAAQRLCDEGRWEHFSGDGVYFPIDFPRREDISAVGEALAALAGDESAGR